MAIDPAEFPLIAADLAYLRGMAHRQLDDEQTAQIWLSKATINGVLTEPAKRALAESGLRLVTTDESLINTRTNSGTPAPNSLTMSTRIVAPNCSRKVVHYCTTRWAWPRQARRWPNSRIRSRCGHCG